MKRFLPKLVNSYEFIVHRKKTNNSFGFTLVELLVIITVIAILAVIGIAVYGNVAGKGRDAKRRADVDAHIKALEISYDGGTNVYRALTGADFAGGTAPIPPEGGTYTVTLGASNRSATVCAPLEGNTGTCTASSATCYCRSTAQGSSVAPAGPVNCVAFNNLTTQTCATVNTVPACAALGATIYIKCSEISLFTGVTTVNCSGNGQQTNNIPYYTSDTAGVASAGSLRLYGTTTCPANQATVNIRATN